jgi:hypothetical protein
MELNVHNDDMNVLNNNTNESEWNPGQPSPPKVPILWLITLQTIMDGTQDDWVPNLDNVDKKQAKYVNPLSPSGWNYPCFSAKIYCGLRFVGYVLLFKKLAYSRMKNFKNSCFLTESNNFINYILFILSKRNFRYWN